MSLDVSKNDISTEISKDDISINTPKNDRPVKALRKNKKYLKKIIVLVLVVLSLPLALTVMKLRTNLTPKADVSSEASYLSFSIQESMSGYRSNSSIKANGTVAVDINLVNGGDLAHVVTGVDALMSYDKDILEPIEIKNGSVFESLTRQVINSDLGSIEISGSYSKIKDDQGNPVGYAGNGGVLASVVFKTKQEGNAKLSFVYNGGQDTSDSNIIAFKKGEVVSGQMPKERFLQKPTDFAIEVVGEATEEVALSSRCETCNSSLPPSAPNSRCEEGLVCKYEDVGDGIMMAGASGLCVGSDETFASCETEKIVIDGLPTKPSPNIEVIDINGSPTRPTPTPTIVRPKAKLQIVVSMLDRQARMTSPVVGTYSDGSSEILHDAKYSTNHSIKGVLYGIEVGEVKGVSIASALGDLDKEFAEIKVERIGGDTDEGGCYTSAGYSWCESKQKCLRLFEESCDDIPGGDVDEHGCKGSAGYSWCESKQKCLRPWEESCDGEDSSLVKIASFVTDQNGSATVTIPEQYEGKTMNLFIRTPSHLRKFAEGGEITLPIVPGCLYKDPIHLCDLAVTIQEFKFTSLIPGDIYIASGQSEQDNIINTFDAIELIKHMGASSVGASSGGFKESQYRDDGNSNTTYGDSRSTSSHRADLNGDDVVNTRDLKILIDHLGKRGD